jgi:spore coat polysaccharide biosynthesis protein SpsF
MKPRIAIVLQARMGSTRLPGKSLAFIEGKSLIHHCIDRLRSRSGLMVLLATTTLAEDDPLADEASRLSVPVVRGSADDVLARFARAASLFELTTLVRATADKPAVDMDAPRRTLELLTRTGVDHVVEHGLPYGCAVEAISCQALHRAHALASDAYDREHVTPFLKRDHRFRSLDLLAPAALRRPDRRFTVDTADDLEFIRGVYRTLQARLRSDDCSTELPPSQMLRRTAVALAEAGRRGPAVAAVGRAGGSTPAPLSAIIHASDVLLAAEVEEPGMGLR